MTELSLRFGGFDRCCSFDFDFVFATAAVLMMSFCHYVCYSDWMFELGFVAVSFHMM